jgi:uncharacterized protein (DUF362 family)
MKEAPARSASIAVANAGADVYESPALARDLTRTLARTLGWTSGQGGAFGSIVGPNDKVVVKPNWVLHENQAGTDFDPLITHATLTGAVIAELLESEASSIVLGDAPIQGCHFPELLTNMRYDRRIASVAGDDRRFHGPVDFRRTISSVSGGVRTAREDARSLDQYVLFDLGEHSYLEPVTSDGKFRVTMYPPALMQRTHAPGRHQYLVAREIIEADVVVNLPKLKTHKKAGVTCALKNLVGINGNKEFLPHHRLGPPSEGGDCYPEASTTKALLERVLDLQNTFSQPFAQRPLAFAARVLDGIARRQGDRVGVEGAWSENDTVWRMCLDLNRILVYGHSDGTISSNPQRRVLTIVDAIVAGQGDGPLAPVALPMGLLYAGDSPAAVDWFSAALLGYAPDRIPIVRGAFQRSTWPLVDFVEGDIRVVESGEVMTVAQFLRSNGRPRKVEHPAGWENAVATVWSPENERTERD